MLIRIIVNIIIFVIIAATAIVMTNIFFTVSLTFRLIAMFRVKVMVFIAAFAVVIFLLHLLSLIRYGFLPKNRNNFAIVMLVLGYLWIFLLRLILSFIRKVFCKINCTVLKLTCVCVMQGPDESSQPNPPITSDFEVL